jgi:hypothetical protein
VAGGLVARVVGTFGRLQGRAHGGADSDRVIGLRRFAPNYNNV